MGWKLITSRHFQSKNVTTVLTEYVNMSSDSTAISAPFGNIGGAGPHLTSLVFLIGFFIWISLIRKQHGFHVPSAPSSVRPRPLVCIQPHASKHNGPLARSFLAFRKDLVFAVATSTAGSPSQGTNYFFGSSLKIRQIPLRKCFNGKGRAQP